MASISKVYSFASFDPLFDLLRRDVVHVQLKNDFIDLVILYQLEQLNEYHEPHYEIL